MWTDYTGECHISNLLTTKQPAAALVLPSLCQDLPQHRQMSRAQALQRPRQADRETRTELRQEPVAVGAQGTEGPKAADELLGETNGR